VSERDERRVAEVSERLERQTDEMQTRADKLGDHIESVRQDFTRKRNDTDVVGLPPTPEEASPTEAESGAASIVEDSFDLPGNPGDEGVHGEDPNDTHEDER
jgi:hypothetical protein